MKFFLKKRVGKDPGNTAQCSDEDDNISLDYTVANFLTDFKGHKEDLQEWGQIVRSFSMFEEYGGKTHQSRSFNGIHKGMSKKRSDNKTTQEGKALYRLRQKLMKKKNLQKKKERQLKTEIVRTNSNLNSRDSFSGEDLKGRTVVIYNKSREVRNPESLPRQSAYEQRDSLLLEEPCYCGTLEDTLDTLGDTLEEYHNMEAERMQRRKQMLKVTSKVEKVKKKKKKNFKVHVHNGLK